jgi:hypothetical protein
MRLADFADLISNMPVSNQAFASKRSTWTTHINGTDTAGAGLQAVFDAYKINPDNIFLSRGDLRDLALKPHLAEFVMATIIWGYPRGMRGHNLRNMTSHLDSLCQILSDARSCPISDWISHYENVRPIHGIGISTYTKLLHFLSAKIEGHEALILDQRIIDVAQGNLFEELASICNLTSANASRLYPKYLECMDDAASRLSLPPDKIEFFLFEFGLHLKAGDEDGVAEVSRTLQESSNDIPEMIVEEQL